MNMRSYLIGAAMFAALGQATVAQAGTAAFGVNGSAFDAGEPNHPVNLGTVFTATANESVDALGFYTAPATTGEQVGLYNGSGTLLASTTVPLTGPAIGGYAYQAIAPVALTAGATYTVVDFVGNNDWDYGPVNPTVSAGIAFQYHNYLYTTSLQDTSQTGNAAGGPDGVYYGPNLQLGAVPEPATWAMMLTGLGFVGFSVRRRARFLRQGAFA